MATHPIASPISTTRPSHTTTRGYNDNSFPFPTKAWPTAPTGRTIVSNSPGVDPLSVQSYTMAMSMPPPPPPPPTMPSSPVPPRPGKQQYQQSPGRTLTANPKLSASRDGLNNISSSSTMAAVAKDLRQSLASRHGSAERYPQQSLLSSSLDTREIWRIQRTDSVGPSVNSAPLRSRDPPSSSRYAADSASVQSSAADLILEHMEPWMALNNSTIEPDDSEQALFEQRLTEDYFGVAVRKIAQNGKSSLRYIKCMYVDASELDSDSSSNRSLSSQTRRFPRFRADRTLERKDSLLKGNKVKVLCWGNKKEVKLPVDKFVCVRTGKTTDRSRRNTAPASRILSLITEDRFCRSLDIETPTKVDRDKFAKAFSRFLGIPLDSDENGSIPTENSIPSWKELPKSNSSSHIQQAAGRVESQIPKSNASVGHVSIANSAASDDRKPIPVPEVNTSKEPPPVSREEEPILSPSLQNEGKEVLPKALPLQSISPRIAADAVSTSKDISVTGRQSQRTTPSVAASPGDDDDESMVSSITGAGYDHDLVEELHLALTKMKKELDESRAEAARAVKVAEQAIQSAEKSTSKDWNTTVTHKAAEAAAIAQKRSAEALAIARLAEERLDQEKKKAGVWRKQAEAALEEAGHWQTRAAIAEVQRAAVAELLESHQQRYNGNSTVSVPESEVERLRSKLALESATRRKLLHEVQDLRGHIRVYCRLRAPTGTSVVTVASQEVLMLHRERASFMSDGATTITPLTFEFDGILDSGANQQEVYGEMETVCLSALDGYNSCIIAHGQSGAGKTYTMVGDVTFDRSGEVSIENFGIHLLATQQFFSIIDQRIDRYEDTVTFSLVEVSNERLSDLLSGIDSVELGGISEGSNSSKIRREATSQDGVSDPDKLSKLEIKTNRDGETAVHGLISVKVTCTEDVLKMWKHGLKSQRRRLVDQSTDIDEHRTNSHVIATFRVNSKNVSTGVSTVGKIQFVDLASSNVVARRLSVKKGSSTPESVIEGIGIGTEVKYTNRSMAALSEVMTARSQFHRSVPYRNATITHLLSDSLEGDAKVVLVTCISSDLQDLQETACALKFAQIARKVVLGNATKHTRNAVL